MIAVCVIIINCIIMDLYTLFFVSKSGYKAKNLV